MEKEWWLAEGIDGLDSPALLVYPARVKKNIQALLQHADALRTRPHVKTNKMAEVCSMMMDHGIRKFKAATIAEAEMLAEIKAPDVLLAYPLTPVKAERFIRLMTRYPETRFSFLADSEQNIQTLTDQFKIHQLQASVYIDLNVGMNRTGILPEKALILAKAILSNPVFILKGLHAYDGHIRDSDITVRTKDCHKAFKPVLALRKEIEKITGAPIDLVAGGTPSCLIHAAQTDRDCSPGTFVFWDKGYADKLPEQPFQFGALLLSRVISIPAPDLICTDLGHKSVAAENPFPRIYFLNAPDAEPVSQSEEHLVLKVANSSKYKTGDTLFGVPIHICPSVALYDEAAVIEDGRLAGRWKVVARKRKISV
jgi:D-serine deaminase-like pyridoxal phosphate-dependent protein